MRLVTALTLLPAVATAGTYTIDVDFGTSIGEAQGVAGVNKGVLAIDTVCRAVGDEYDFSDLYTEVEVDSARTHDDATDSAITYLDGTYVLMEADPHSGTAWSYGDASMPWSLSNDWSSEGCFTGNPTESLRYNISVYSDLTDPANYSYQTSGSALERSIDATVAAGLELYYRAGTDWNSATYTQTRSRLAQLGANLLDWILGRSASVQFVEIWNEPDGNGWHGSDAEFASLYYSAWHAEDAVKSSYGADFEIGGAGFADEAFYSDLVGNYLGGSCPSGHVSDADLATEVMRRYAPDGLFPFVSFHWYGDGDESGATPTGELGALATHLDEVRTSLDNFCDCWDLDPCPSMHLTEWNYDLPSVLQEGDTTDNLFTTAKHGSFAAAALTVMLDPELDLERAHFYDGRGPTGIFFSYSDAGDWFQVRPAGQAWWLLRDFDGRRLVETNIDDGSTSGDALDVAQAGVGVVAAGVRNAICLAPSCTRSVVISNADSSAHTVTLNVAGLGTSGSVPYTLTRLVGATAQDVTANCSGGTCTPDASELAALFSGSGAFTETSSSVTGSSATVSLSVTPHEVLRVDFEGGPILPKLEVIRAPVPIGAARR